MDVCLYVSVSVSVSVNVCMGVCVCELRRPESFHVDFLLHSIQSNLQRDLNLIFYSETSQFKSR